MLINRLWAFGWILLAGCLSACGGATNTAPVADAGADQRAEGGSVVSLSGAGSGDADGNPLTFAWTFSAIPAGSDAALSNSASVAPSFTPDLDGTYVVSLVVNDGRVSSPPDSVSVVVTLGPQAQADLAMARAAALRAVLTASTGTVRLEWQDSFPEATQYRVEAQAADGSFAAVETVPGYGVAAVALRSREIAKGAPAYRVQALTAGRTVPLRTTGSKANVVDQVTSSSIPQILLDGPEPIPARAQLSLGAANAFDKVAWSLDGVAIGDGGKGAGNPLAWDFGRESSGTHTVSARIAFSREWSIDVERDLQVSNALPAVSFFAFSPSYVFASAASGIASVALSVNGRTVATLTAPNACSPGPRADLRCGISFYPPVRYDSYSFDIDGLKLASGDYVLVYTITDGSGQSVQRLRPITIGNPPVIDLASPPDGALAHGSLRLRTSLVADLPGTVTVTASLATLSRDPRQAFFQTILSTTGTAIDQEADLTSVPPGTYSLSVTARNRGGSAEVRRTIVVTSSRALRYDPFYVGDGFGLAQFAAEGDLVAYRDQNNQVRLVNVATAAKRDLGVLPRELIVSGGRFYSTTWMPGCSTTFGFVCLYEWSLSGPVKPVADGYSAGSFQLLARGSTLAWTEYDELQGQRIRLYDADRAQAVTITPPAGTTVDDSTGANPFDFDSRNGRVELVYTARPATVAQPGAGQIVRWSSSTGQTRLYDQGTFNQRVVTDGARVAWWQVVAEPGGLEPRASLLSQPLDGATATTLSGSVKQTVLRDGLLAWLETTPTGLAIKVSTLTGIQTIATDTLQAAGGGIGPGNEDSTWLFDTSSGFVLYRQGRKFLAWDGTTNQSRVVMDTADVSQVQLNGGFAYFTIARSLYRVPLGF